MATGRTTQESTSAEDVVITHSQNTTGSDLTDRGTPPTPTAPTPSPSGPAGPTPPAPLRRRVQRRAWAVVSWPYRRAKAWNDRRRDIIDLRDRGRNVAVGVTPRPRSTRRGGT